MKNKFFILFFQLFLSIVIINTSELSEIDAHIILNLKEEKKEINGLSETDYVKETMYNNYYSKFNIGIPAQRLKFYYEINEYEISLIEGEYEQIRSTTYKLLDDKKYPNEFLSQEKFEICQEIFLDNFTFLLKKKNLTKEKNDTNILGLSLKKNKESNSSLSFLYQLKQSKYIEKQIYTFLFEDDMINARRGIDAQILIGCLPHEVNPEFEEKDLKWISLSNNKNEINKGWHINFDTVKYNNDELENKRAYFDLTLNSIIGPENFRQKLLQVFFKNQLEKKTCKENYIYNLKDEKFYIYYSCSMEAEFIDIPNLSFYNQKLNEFFNLSFSGLFTKYHQRFYFNIIFSKIPQNDWVFGQLFFKSYRFVFNVEEEKIGYYKTIQSKERPFIVIIALAAIFMSFGISYIYYTNKYDNNGNNNYMYQNIGYPIRSEYNDNKNDNLGDKSNDISKKNHGENNTKMNMKEKQN